MREVVPVSEGSFPLILLIALVRASLSSYCFLLLTAHSWCMFRSLSQSRSTGGS